jgi:sodium/potassium/calcium exchanger 6
LETICEDDKESASLRDDIERDDERRFAHYRLTGERETHPLKRALAYVHICFSTITNRMVIPVEYVLRATIPVAADTESFDRTWFTISCGISPVWALLYLSSFSPTWTHMLVVISLGAVFFYLAWYMTQEDGHDTPACVLGTNIPIGAALVALYGFALAGMWIDTIAGELVGVIHTFGIIGHVKPSILGLTVLAWGNSLTDLMANISIALQSSGGASMAMTACFAGPLFNLLLGLGIGFTLYLTEKDVSSVPVEFDIIVFIGCIFAIINCIGIISIALTHNQRLPKWSGWLMMGWYGLYMTLILTISTVS